MKSFKILLLLTCIGFVANAQTVINGATVSIKENAILSSFDVNNNGTIINEGLMFLRGSWIDNGDYQSETGRTILGGSARQDVDHSSRIFRRLEVAGGGEKVLAKDIVVLDELVLSDGVLRFENDSRLYFGQNIEIEGGSDLSYIEGPIVHRGTGNKMFPVGANDTYYPIQLRDLTGSELEMQVQANSPNPLNELSGILEAVTENVAWEVTAVGGEWEGSVVDVAIKNEDFNGISQDVVVVHGKPDGAYQSIGQSDFSGTFTDGTVTSTQEATYSLISYGFLALDPQPAINVFNAVSPNGDGLHDFLFIENIESFPNNEVYIYNRFGDRVFQTKGYRNDDSNFRFIGNGNVGGYGTLPDGTYYFTIDPGSSNSDKVSGFLVLKR